MQADHGPLAPRPEDDPGERQELGARLPVGLPDGLHVATVRALGDLTGGFTRDLYERAKFHMRDRKSNILTDSDLYTADRELRSQSGASRMQRIIGDGAIAIGGCAMGGGVAIHWVVSVLGVVILILGLLFREWKTK